MTLSNRLRNMTMNCGVGKSKLHQRDRPRFVAFCRDCDANKTHSDGWIVCKDILVGRTWLSLPWGR